MERRRSKSGGGGLLTDCVMEVWKGLGSSVPTCPHGPLLLFDAHSEESMRKAIAEQRGSSHTDTRGDDEAGKDDNVAGLHTHVFFACSAHRDESCVGHVTLDKLQRFTSKQPHYDHRFKEASAVVSSAKTMDVPGSSKHRRSSLPYFCRTCSLLVPGRGRKHRKGHAGHDLVPRVTPQQLARPTLLLTPASKRRQNAQYLFSARDTAFVLDKLRTLGARRVVCMGCPSIHEAIQCQNQQQQQQQQEEEEEGGEEGEGEERGRVHRQEGQDKGGEGAGAGAGAGGGMAAEGATGNAKVEDLGCGSQSIDSFLLDLDARYAQFYPSTYANFNMLNTFFFDAEEEERAKRFMAIADCLIVDPPFGCPLAALAHAVHWVQDQTPQHRRLPVLLFFPYFSAPGLAHALPELGRSNYCVAYTNHKSYTRHAPSADNGNSSRNGGNVDGQTKRAKVCSSQHGAQTKASPVRIYTNLDLSTFSLPNDHYRFCEVCRIWTFRSAPHCSACNTCPSINGEAYSHCTKCDTCVKPRRTHCDTCNRCVLPSSHVCGETLRQTHGRCLLCGSSDHAVAQCRHRSCHLGAIAAACQLALGDGTAADKGLLDRSPQRQHTPVQQRHQGQPQQSQEGQALKRAKCGGNASTTSTV